MRRLLLALIATASLAAVALAHSWYDAECCSGIDCAPVACDDIAETPRGWTFRGLTFTNIKPSKDRNCHACIGGGKPLCLYVLQGS